MAPRDEPTSCDEANEATPLLASRDTTQSNGHARRVPAASADESGDDRPLPLGQIFFLCLARLIDPLSFFAIFPFIPKMVEDMNVREEDVGFYTGAIESLFSITQMCTMFFWGKAADRYGRKPILVLSLIGVSLASASFGLSSSVWQMVLFRALAGAFSGSVVSIRAMFHEVSTPKTTARAFSFFAVANNFGIFLGPLIGSLARPADEYPGAFGHVQFFKDWPYVLPTLVVGALGLIAALVSVLFVKETLPETLLHKPHDARTMSTTELLGQPGVVVALVTYLWASMLGTAFTAVLPVLFFTPINLGGFGFSNKTISLFFALIGIAQGLWLLVVFPPLQQRIGTKRLLQWCGIFWPFLMLFFSLDNWFLRQNWRTLFWSVALPVQVIGVGVSMAFTGVQLSLNEASPSPEVLGTLNGLALALQSGLRAVVPALFSALFAIGVREHILGGQFGIVILAVVAAGFFPLSSALKSPGGAKGKHKADDEEQVQDSSHVENRDNH